MNKNTVQSGVHSYANGKKWEEIASVLCKMRKEWKGKNHHYNFMLDSNSSTKLCLMQFSPAPCLCVLERIHQPTQITWEILLGKNSESLEPLSLRKSRIFAVFQYVVKT